MTTIVGRGVRVEVSKTEGTAKVVTAVSKAKPGVASSTAHALPAKSIGYFRGVEGMVQLEGQAARLAAVTSDNFTLEDINTTDYPDFTDQAEFVPITAWATLAKATSYGIGGGDAEKLDDTSLLDDIKQEVNGLLAAQSVSIGLNAETIASEAMAIIRDAARRSAYLVFRITLKDGNVRVFRGQPSLPGEEVQKGALGTGSLSVTIKGFVTEGAA
ncbi:phage tail protein [Aquincola sp. J276]|uniref:phage tail protein n=1 Tax=Aquincola sp. J276 TaxID=2898432 RepID=UPI00215199D2|nr:phage tail protein [Aquincola sp. J276]MCR5864651.1 phage tail protein [Aquincola sp. J276]